MDLRQLRYFVVIAERGSFSAAAQALHIAQSALSRHVQLLELEFGGPLFDRNARGVTINEAGTVLLERARFILGEVENLRAEVSAHNRELTGTVRIAAPPTLADFLFLPIAAHFTRLHPRVTLRFREALSEAAIDELVAGALDLALVSGNPKPNDLLHFIPRVREKVYVFGPPGSPLLEAPAIRMADIDHEKLVRSAESLPPHQSPAQQARGDGYVQTDNVALLRRMVKAGLGYGVLPYSGVHADLERGEIAASELLDRSSIRYIALPSRRPLSRATREVLQVIDEEFDRQIAAGRLRLAEASPGISDFEMPDLHKL